MLMLITQREIQMQTSLMGLVLILLGFLTPLPPLTNPSLLLPMAGPLTLALVDMQPLVAIQQAPSILNHSWGATGATLTTGDLTQEVTM